MKDDGNNRNSGQASRAYGLWRDKPVDGLSYQDQLRKEWERIRLPS